MLTTFEIHDGIGDYVLGVVRVSENDHAVLQWLNARYVRLRWRYVYEGV